MTKLYLYTIFHLNLAYSSIPEEDQPQVIEHCFWPLLDLCERTNIAVGIEAPGYTLEKLNEISPAWLFKLSDLCKKGACEFIGSGYAQLIGPLVPADVNAHNLQIGHQVYQSLLGLKPHIAYVNEQAYSPGLIEHYLDADYRAIIMELNNPYRYHPQWPNEWQYYPQLATDSNGKTIPVIWNNSISFQKFQRYAQGELQLDEYMSYLHHLKSTNHTRFLPLYGNDAEIFDYRPGRYDTEVDIYKDGEWKRIVSLFKELDSNPVFEILPPSKVLALAEGAHAFNRIRLESPEEPIPVKKQEKYNIIRWAVTGRDDVGINTICHQIYELLNRLENGHKYGGIQKTRAAEGKPALDALWKSLCFLWSSDFRTHIEAKRYHAFQERLDNTLAIVTDMLQDSGTVSYTGETKKELLTQTVQPRVEQKGRLIHIETGNLKVSLNTRRGLAIESVIFKGISDLPLIGTLPHGYYDDISLGADYYTGHTIIEIPGSSKITDLENALLTLPGANSVSDEFITIKGAVNTHLGTIYKEVKVHLSEMRLDISYRFDLAESLPSATFRTGIITFMPAAFDQDTLFFSTHNGGKNAELHKLKGHRVSHGEPASAMVSAKHCLGATEGWVVIGDKAKKIKIYSDKSKLYNVPMVDYREVKHGGYFLRLLHSIGEIDDTAKCVSRQRRDITFTISCAKQ